MGPKKTKNIENLSQSSLCPRALACEAKAISAQSCTVRRHWDLDEGANRPDILHIPTRGAGEQVVILLRGMPRASLELSDKAFACLPTCRQMPKTAASGMELRSGGLRFLDLHGIECVRTARR